MSNLIWEAKLDEKYQCEVNRIDERKASLTVVNIENQNVLLDKEVGLSYGAMFGPDMSDVALWQELCINVVDGKTAND